MDLELTEASQIAVIQAVPVIVCFQPMIQMDLVEIRSHKFCAQLVRLGAEEWHPEPSQRSNQ